MKKLITVLSLILIAQTTFALNTEVWDGNGSLFNKNGQKISDYKLVVKSKELTSKTTQRNVTVTMSDGSVKKIQCIVKKGLKGWSSNCDNGLGGGYCFGEGLCQSYLEDASGNAFATSIIMDGRNDMRILRTQLENGHAVRFFREKLIRKTGF